MKFSAVFGAFALSASVAGIAYAGPLPKNSLDSDEKAWIYNRPGATLGDWEADLVSCLDYANKMTAHASVGGLLEYFLEQARTAGPRAAHIDDCMIARSYRRFDILGETQKAFQKRFDAMSVEVRTGLVGSSAPNIGKLARQFVNTMWLSRGDEVEQGSMLRLVEPVVAKSWGSENRMRGVKPGRPIAVGPNDAVLVLTTNYTGQPLMNGTVEFARRDPLSGDRAAISADGKAKPKVPILEARSGSPERPTQFLMVAPAGTYSLEMVVVQTKGFKLTQVQFCQGTISFSVAPRDVVDLGSFVVEAKETIVSDVAPVAPFRLRVDATDLEARRRLLASEPALAAKLAPVTYSNDFKNMCLPPIGTIGIPAYGIAIPRVSGTERFPAD